MDDFGFGWSLGRVPTLFSHSLRSLAADHRAVIQAQQRHLNAIFLRDPPLPSTEQPAAGPSSIPPPPTSEQSKRGRKAGSQQQQRADDPSIPPPLPKSPADIKLIPVGSTVDESIDTTRKMYQHGLDFLKSVGEAEGMIQSADDMYRRVGFELRASVNARFVGKN